MSAMNSYGQCPFCGTEVPVERRFPKATVLLLLLMAASIVATLLFFPRFLFLFIFLPIGFGLWKRAAFCTICGKRIPRSSARRATL